MAITADVSEGLTRPETPYVGLSSVFASAWIYPFDVSPANAGDDYWIMPVVLAGRDALGSNSGVCWELVIDRRSGLERVVGRCVDSSLTTITVFSVTPIASVTPANQWTGVAMAWDGTSGGGVLATTTGFSSANSATGTGPLNTPGQALRIGYSIGDPARAFDGHLAEVVIGTINRTPSAAELEAWLATSDPHGLPGMSPISHDRLLDDDGYRDRTGQQAALTTVGSPPFAATHPPIRARSRAHVPLARVASVPPAPPVAPLGNAILGNGIR